MSINFDKEDLIFFSSIKKQIDELTDQEIILKQKTSQKIDRKSIRDKKEREFLDNLNTLLQNIALQCSGLGEELKKDNIQIYEKLKSFCSDKESIIEKYKDYSSIKELKNQCKNLLSQEELKNLAEIGAQHFDQNRFNEARLYFLFLSVLEPFNANHCISKGMAEQNMKNYDEAIASYFMAITLDSTQLLPYLEIIDCFILSNRIDEAKQIFSQIEKEVHPNEYADNPFYASKIKIIRDSLAKR